MNTTADCKAIGHIGYKRALDATPYKAWQSMPTALKCERCGVYAKLRNFSDYVAPAPVVNGATHQIEDGHRF